MKRLISIFFLSLILVFSVNAEKLTAEQCDGSLAPYPVPTQNYEYPDSLKPVFINHIGRHGSRYPAGSTTSYLLQSYLNQADTLGTITPLGKKFLGVVNEVIRRSDGRWGHLDSLGMAEHRGIASRMFANYPMLLQKGKVEAISSYSQRVVMSMYSFTHQLALMSKNIEISTKFGKCCSPLMRFFEVDTAYINYHRNGAWKKAYREFYAENSSPEPMRRLLGVKFPASDDVLRDLSLNEYYLIAGMRAMEMDFDYTPYMSLDELNKMWSLFNFRQYLQRAASTVSNTPIKAALPLLNDVITTADAVLTGKLDIQAKLRFGHAETMIPLLSLMTLDGCYYLTHYYDTVADNWRDGYVSPMATNLQLVYYTSPSGTIYVRGDLNEVPVHLMKGNDSLYVTWDEYRSYLLTLSL